MNISTIKVYGATVDSETRCKHYHSTLDVVAIKFKCCGRYYPCYKCHMEAEDHSIQRWQANELDNLAILCGVCKTELPINEYIGATKCPNCGADFNPGCKNHFDIYFDLANAKTD